MILFVRHTMIKSFRVEECPGSYTEPPTRDMTRCPRCDQDVNIEFAAVIRSGLDRDVKQAHQDLFDAESQVIKFQLRVAMAGPGFASRRDRSQ